MKKIILSAGIVLIAFAACKTSSKSEKTTTSKPVPATPAGPTYTADIKPIMEMHCVKCHGEDGRAGYNLTSLDDVKRAGKNGYLLGTVKWEDGFAPMPARADKLDAKTIALIESWVKTGMN